MPSTPVRLALLALIVLPLACADAPEPVVPPAEAPPLETYLTGRVWMGADTTGLPGVMRVFLPDGTLVMDSCWETFRLAPWELRAADSTITWREDVADVAAKILEVGPDRLRLQLQLVGETREEAYVPAEVPYLCPDMPR